MASSLITSAHSALIRIKGEGLVGVVFDECKLKIGLRNLKVLLLLCLKVEDAHLEPLFSRIEDVTARLLLLEKIQVAIVSEVHCLGKQVDEKLSEAVNNLTEDDIVLIADSILENIADFLTWARDLLSERATNAFEVIDAFEVQTRFLKDFFRFAMQAGVELQNLLLLVQPICIESARVFIEDGDDEWCTEVASKCSSVLQMAADPQLYQVYSQVLIASKSCFSTESHLQEDPIFKNLLCSLISILWDVLRGYSDSPVKDQLKALYERLRFCRSLLKQQPAGSDDKTMSQIGVLVCDAGVAIFSLHQTDSGMLSGLLQRFAVFEAQVELQFNPPTPSYKLGFDDDEVTSVLDRLTRGSKQLSMVPICGMAGLGKTTFALQVYNHPSVGYHFHARAWCPVSQILDKKKVLLQLLNQIRPGYYLELSGADIETNLYQSLRGKRYLILLDDVWSPEVWNHLKYSCPNDDNGSRIVLTSRHIDIVPDEKPHLLRLREDNECLEMLQMKLHHKEGWTTELGMEIAKMCKGLPLTVVIIAGLLASTDKDGWKAILDQLSSGALSGAESALELSYSHLPDYLKPCFLYFGAFPEDDEVSVKWLIRLWMAEGFVKENDQKRIEDVAGEYMMKLVERSLVMVAKNNSIGGVKTCRIHDLLHDFCVIKGKQGSFFSLLLQRYDQLSDFIEPCNLKRLFIHSFPSHLKNSRLFCPNAQSMLFFTSAKSWRESHLFDMSFIIQIFQLLRVLDIYQIVLANGIPNEIELLTQLRYLSIRTLVPVIPSSVGSLSNLETFITYFPTDEEISFPDTLWNLQKLKYLHIRSVGEGATLPTENLENSPSLLELETLCGVIFCSDGSMEKQMRKFPNIRRLKCSIRHGLESTEDFHKIVIPSSLGQLESLTMRGRDELKCEFGSTENLRKVKLDGFELSREEIAVIGKLPNLTAFKLSDVHFPENTLEMEEGEFEKVRFLKLFLFHSLERWTACDYQLPCLRKLVFSSCTELEEIPSCFERSSAIEEIHVLECSSNLESLVRQIEEVHDGYGNLVKVHIRAR